MDREPGRLQSRGLQELDTTERLTWHGTWGTGTWALQSGLLKASLVLATALCVTQAKQHSLSEPVCSAREKYYLHS